MRNTLQAVIVIFVKYKVELPFNFFYFLFYKDSINNTWQIITA